MICPDLNHFMLSEEVLGPIALVRLILHCISACSPMAYEESNFTETDETLVSVFKIVKNYMLNL